jgi:hypothetical protein
MSKIVIVYFEEYIINFESLIGERT